MAIYLYDEAVADKIRKWILDPNVVVTAPDETRRIFEYTADTSNDETVKLPLITLRRANTIEISNPHKHTKTFDGAVIVAGEKAIATLNVIPIQISYQLDIYCRYRKEADEYARNFVFNLINYPKVTVKVPYNGSHIEHDSNISLNGEIIDNSDIPERLIAGQFTRYTLSFVISDAYLFSVPVRIPIKLETEYAVNLEGSDIKDAEVLKIE